MNFCPQCGTRFEPEARFCQECGFDINSVIEINELIPKPIIQPEIVVENTLPPLQSESLPTSPEPTRFTTDKTSQHYSPGKPPIKLNSKKKYWIWIVLAVIILGVGGWYAYNLNIFSGKLMPFTFDSNSIITENPANKQPETDTKPMSLMDQELAKQKAQNKISPKDESNNENVETINASDTDIIPEIILEVGHKEEPKSKNPKNPTKLTLQKPTMITRITTDHYNDGMGTPRGGKIIIKDKNEKVIGSFKALGKTGKNGTPSAKWVAEPNIMLQKGTYYISDSEMTTWSKTFIGSNGFIVVEGYEVE